MKITEETKNKINQLEPQTLLAHGIIRLVPGKTDEYICPICGNGGHGNRDATGIIPKIYPDHVGWKCHRCGEAFDNIAIFAVYFGLSAKTDFVTLCQKICDRIELPIFYDVPNVAQKKSEVNPAELNIINQDLATDIQPLKDFIDQCGGSWRGLPFTILEKFGCRFIKNWTSPKSRAGQTFHTPTPRMIIPASRAGLTANYLARLTVPKNSFDETAQKYIREKEHAGKKTLFNFDALHSKEPVFVVEGYIDAITLEFVGFRAVATGGADSFNLLVEAVKPLEKKPDVVILFDPDETGRSKAPQLKNALADLGCRVVVKFLTNNVSKTDANSILQEQGADFLINDIFAIEQEAKKDFETNSKPPKPEMPKTESEKPATPEKRNSSAIKLSFEQKKFLYSGDFSDLDFAQRIEFLWHDEIRWLRDDNSWLILERNNQGGAVWKNYGEKKSVIAPYALKLSKLLISNAAPVPEEPEIPTNADGSVSNDPIIRAQFEKAREDFQKKSDLHEFQVKLGKHFKKQKNISQAIEIMKGIVEILIVTEALNRHKHLLNVLNGVVDLKTGKLLPSNPNYLFTNQAGAIFDPDADTSFVEKFLADILPDDDTRRAILRYLGYSLTGEKIAQVSEFWKGSGANGKSTLIDLLKAVFGTYATELPITALMRSARPIDPNAPTPAIMLLDGDKRLAIVNELQRNVYLDGPLYKKIVTDRTGTGRFLHGNFREIEMRAKIIMSGNHLPNFDVGDEAVIRRITNVPFTQTFKGDRADTKLTEKLLTPENRAAFLKIIVNEAVNFYREGLLESDEMKAAKEAYVIDNDFISNFIDDKCEIGNGGEITRKAFEEKLTAEYPRECSRLKKKELLDQIISRLEPKNVFYMQNRTKCNVFRNIRWLDSEA